MGDNELKISNQMLLEWRHAGIISGEEIAFKKGDLFVAENVITQARRIIDPTPTMRESSSNKRVLKG